MTPVVLTAVDVALMLSLAYSAGAVSAVSAGDGGDVAVLLISLLALYISAFIKTFRGVLPT